ncbi:alpha/beta fold hydrolase [Maritalea mediterranea]|uniref:Alpha/beta hydrolase n=1 Tax=Maritalea mediterranea TaxID=2909667 RepID=A0ABS9E9I2_9HYPH|nr:alpha/beta hydrolase [Maritalea mediterranea]MCF4099536.1 alpha/beta hydrolase [Maritalea mediterranea]
MTKTGTDLHGTGTFIDTRFGQIYYETEGEGPPVFLVSGGPGTGHAHYHPWFSALADRHQLVYFDNLGAGRSVRMDDPTDYNLANYAEVIEALRKALGFEKISLIGLSFGSLPALAYAVTFRQHIAALVISNGHFSAQTWQQGNIDNMNYEVRQLFPEIWAEIMALRDQGVLSSDMRIQALYGRALGELFWVDPWDHPGLFRPEGAEEADNFDVYRAFVGDDPEWEVTGTLKGFNPTAQLADFDVPTLIVSGRYDRITPPSIAVQIKEALPVAPVTLEIFERSAHRPWVEEADLYFECVSAFLEDIDG